jgi:hypothetical protein
VIGRTLSHYRILEKLGARDLLVMDLAPPVTWDAATRDLYTLDREAP